jgi:hypothetical protein
VTVYRNVFIKGKPVKISRKIKNLREDRII